MRVGARLDTGQGTRPVDGEDRHSRRRCTAGRTPVLVKGLLRKAEAWTKEALVEAIGWALTAVTSGGARAFIEHCGYRMSVQSLC
jgi:hypothetical protein